MTKEKVECFHIPSISQLRDIPQILFFPKDLTTKLKTGVRVLKNTIFTMTINWALSICQAFHQAWYICNHNPVRRYYCLNFIMQTLWEFREISPHGYVSSQSYELMSLEVWMPNDRCYSHGFRKAKDFSCERRSSSTKTARWISRSHSTKRFRGWGLKWTSEMGAEFQSNYVFLMNFQLSYQALRSS